MKTRNNQIKRKAVTIMLAAAMLFTAMPVLSIPAFTASAESITATGKVSASGVNLRKSASTSSKTIKTLKKNKKVTIYKEVFKKKSTKKANRWYYVTVGNKKGYIRSDYVKDIKWSDTAAVVTDDLNYRKGPDTSFKKKGTVAYGNPVLLLIPAKLSGKKGALIKTGFSYKKGQAVKTPGNGTIVMQQDLLLGGKEKVTVQMKYEVNGKKMQVIQYDEDESMTLMSVKSTKNKLGKALTLLKKPGKFQEDSKN